MTSGPNAALATTPPDNVPESRANFLRAEARSLIPNTLGRTLVLAPHPDDESLGCGGTLALLRQANLEVFVAFISDGTQSHPNSIAYPADRLRRLREAEALAALDLLGIPANNAFFMGLPDRQVPLPGSEGHDEATGTLLEIIQNTNPDTILVPFERDPHPDHRATHQLLQSALDSVTNKPRVLEYVVWLWELGQEEDLPRPGERNVLRVDIGAVVELKKQAINAHQSQVTRLIADDPTAFFLSPELLRHFDTPYELFLSTTKTL